MSALLIPSPLLYLAKMILVSSLLYGYYRIFLRNASFHPYNRWYLLGSVLLSVLLPLLHISLSGDWMIPAGWMSGERYTVLLNPGAKGGEAISGLTPVTLTGHHTGLFYGLFRGWNGIYVLYGLTAGFFLFGLFRSLLYLVRLSGKYTSTRVEGIRLFQTEEPGTPFSFLNRLFWNKELALDTGRGRAIFRHELYHIRQKHSLDILVLSVIRCTFWCNPFFYLLLREMKVVHEFLADRYALSGSGEAPAGNDTGVRQTYAEWLVWQSIRGDHRQQIAHSFFNTHLKRRINMITQSKPVRPRYISRVMALPLLFLLFCAFATRARPVGPLPASPDKIAIGKGPGHLPVNDLVRFYLRRLQYPATALQEQQEETIWFSVRLGAGNQLLEFRHYDAEPDLKGRKAYTITVKSLPSRFPNDKAGMVLTPENKKVVFLEEARRASEKIVTDTSRVYPEGEYFFTVVFSIETPIDKKSSLEMEIAPSQKREAGPNAPASAPDTTLEARYPGGSDAWMAFLEKNFKYPLSAYSKNAQGTVVVQFKVEKTGELRDIKVVTDPVPGSGLAEEAIRIFKLSGKWEPAMKNGHAVASYKREPLVFRID